MILQGIICLLGGGSMGSIGEVIKQLRKQRGYTQGQVETFSKGKIKRSYLSNLEAGNITMPSQDKLRALAEVLNTTVREILTRAGVIESPDPDLEAEIAAFIQANPDLGDILLKAMRVLPPEDMREVLEYARYRVERYEEEKGCPGGRRCVFPLRSESRC